jgi:hypothetical protein
MRTPILTAACFAALLGTTALADQPIYKWVDEQGKVHYSTEPHSDNAKQLSIQNNSAAPAAAAPKPASDAGSPPAAGGDVSDAVLLQPQPDDSPGCKAGRDRLFKYLHADKLYKMDDQGNKVTLTADDMKSALDDARNYVRQACTLPAGSSGGGA